MQNEKSISIRVENLIFFFHFYGSLIEYTFPLWNDKAVLDSIYLQGGRNLLMVCVCYQLDMHISTTQISYDTCHNMMRRLITFIFFSSFCYITRRVGRTIRPIKEDVQRFLFHDCLRVCFIQEGLSVATAVAVVVRHHGSAERTVGRVPGAMPTFTPARFDHRGHRSAPRQYASHHRR